MLVQAASSHDAHALSVVSPSKSRVHVMPPVTSSDQFERSPLPRVPAQDNSAFTAQQQVMIPGLSDQQRCYNSGMTTYRGKQVVALRIDDPDASGQGLTQHIAMIEVDCQWRAKGPFCWLKAKPGPATASTDEDPRLAVVDDTLYVIYNMAHGKARRMHVARVEMNEHVSGQCTFVLHDDKKIEFTEGDPDCGWEKNWTPFAYDGSLHLSYTINPPVVLRLAPDKLAGPGTSIVPEVVSRSKSAVRWDFGPMRGGTQAIYEPALRSYVSFFHSSAPATGRQGLARYYVMGFYTFAAHPPFEIERMVQAPLVGAGFYNHAAHLVPYNISVVFPQGLVDSPRAWHVMYGKDDATLHVATVDKDRLLAQCTAPDAAPDADEHAR